jgi:hypothetical protein
MRREEKRVEGKVENELNWMRSEMREEWRMNEG